LENHGSALDAVEKAVVSMEDNPLFNAGKGSALNLLGKIETDAAIMDGRTLRGGGVALLKNVKNPIRVARIVMEKTDHVLIAGEAARIIAISYGVPRADLRVPRRVNDWKIGLRRLRNGRPSHLSHTHREIIEHFTRTSDTVGALALDREGNLAAADSTGGVSLKLPGRIGDSPILGAGLYADNESGAATATGIGEQAMRLVISKRACDLMSRDNAPSAAVKTIRYATRKLGAGTGLIALDWKGRFGVAHNTRNLPWVALTSRQAEEAMFGKRVSR
jgi:beta-aspartyl-peptidase (threonine type)